MPRVMRAASVVLWASLSFLQASWGTEMTAWRKVLVEPTLFVHTVTQTPRELRRTFCGMACVKESWCSLWCFEDPDQCLLTNLIVSASYSPTQPDGARRCYTKMLHDMVFPVSGTSSPVHESYPMRGPEKLMDGYYTYYMNDCGHVHFAAPDGAWFLFDLGSVFTVSEVALMAQPDAYAYKYFLDIEVRVGLSPPPSQGMFESFTLLGLFVGPSETNQRAVLRPEKPLKARYISIQRRSGINSDFVVCHMEIR